MKIQSIILYKRGEALLEYNIFFVRPIQSNVWPATYLSRAIGL